MPSPGVPAIITIRSSFAPGISWTNVAGGRRLASRLKRRTPRPARRDAQGRLIDEFAVPELEHHEPPDPLVVGVGHVSAHVGGRALERSEQLVVGQAIAGRLLLGLAPAA